MKTDYQIEQDVFAELRRQSRVETWHLGVEVQPGKVTLRGMVGSYAERMAAQRLAEAVPGVAQVVNRLLVAIPDHRIRVDAEVLRAARDRIDWDAELPGADIQVSVAGGVVTLAGRVEHQYQRDVAERVIEHLAGVRAIVNNLAISSPGEQAPPHTDILDWHPVHTSFADPVSW
jgi:osmotically-inducible protein OsmY